MIVSVPKETVSDERRVALVPDLVAKLNKAGLAVLVQNGAGVAAGLPDARYQEQGGRLGEEVFREADILLKVQPPTAEEIDQLKEGATVIGFLQPYSNAADIQRMAARKITAFAMELMPRITRAQAMDV